MKKVLYIVVLMFVVLSVHAQQYFSVGSAGMTVLSGTQLYIDSLVLYPSANYTISTNTLTVTYAPTSGPGSASIDVVYNFSSPLNSYSGGLGINYATAALNGNTATNLAIQYYNGSSWSTDNTGSYAANYVSTSASALSGVSVTSVTAGNTTKFYYKGSGDVTATTNWGAQSNGMGTNPADFVTANNTYVLGNYTGSITLAHNFTIGGTLVVNSGADLEAGSDTLTLYDSIVCNGSIGGNGNSTLIVNGRAMNVKFNTTNHNFGKVLINTNAALTLADTMGIAADPAPGYLSIASGGVLNTGNYLVLQSDSNGTARIGTVYGTISGNLIDKQFIPGGRRAYRFWAHPFTASIPLSQIGNYIDITGTGGAENGFTTTITNAPSAYWYHTIAGNSTLGFDPGWMAFTNTFGTPDSNLLHHYEGMRLFIRGSKGEGLDGIAYTPNEVTIAMYGTVNYGNISEPMSRGTLSVSGTPAQDYNLLGNPYPSPADIGTVIANAHTSGYIYGSAFYVWNPYDGTSGQFEAKAIGSAYYIPANTSFEVRASSVSGAALSFTESNKSATISEVLERNSNAGTIGLTIYDTSYHKWDELNIQFNDNATDGEDGTYDAGKPPSPAALNFYSISADNTRLAIDVRPFRSDLIIPLGLKTSYAQQYILSADELPLPAGHQAYIHDKYLGKYVQLSQGSAYRFAVTADTSSQGDSRFELLFDHSDETNMATIRMQFTLEPNPAHKSINITYNLAAAPAASLRIIDMRGVEVFNSWLIASSGVASVDVSSLAPGIYITVITTGSESMSSKFIKY